MKSRPDFPAMLEMLLFPYRTREEWAAKLGTTKAHLRNVIAGRRTANVADAARWAQELSLPKVDATRFIRLAAITHIPAEARAPFVEMVYELEALRALSLRVKRR